VTRAWLLILLLVVFSAGCATPSLPSGKKTTLQAKPPFEPLAADPRVLHEPGAAELAERVAQLMPQAVQQVETFHYRAFAQPVTVHVCGSDACFADHVASKNVSGATVPDNQVFLSPRLFDREAHRLPMILTHELSHLHLGQQIGHFTHRVPIWFHEGLAAYASNGGGADYASEDEARAALRQGRAFAPATLDTADTRHKAEHWQLSPYLFYRQAMMFVGHLKQAGEERFRDFLLRVQDKEDFAQAFGNTYNMSLDEAGQRFVAGFALDAAAPASPIQ
jgi:hypothetical protein